MPTICRLANVRRRQIRMKPRRKKKKRTVDQEEEEEGGGGQEEKIGRKNAPVVRGFAAATAIDNKRGRVEQGNRHSTRI